MNKLDLLNMLSTAQIGFALTMIAFFFGMHVMGVFRNDEPKKRVARHS